MLDPRRPRRAPASTAPASARASTPSHREEQFLVWLSELVNLTENYGRATARLWHELVRGPGVSGAGAGLSRASSDRQWERLKIMLVEHGVPHDVRPIPPGDDSDEAPGAAAVIMRVGKVGLHRYAQRLKRCKAPTCAKLLPPRVPFFHVNPGRADGLSRRCAECENAAARERHRRGLAEGKDPEALERRRATVRVAVAKRRARLQKMKQQRDRDRDAAARAVASQPNIISSKSPPTSAATHASALVKSHARGDS